MNKKFQDGQRRESHVNHQKISMLLTRGADVRTILPPGRDGVAFARGASTSAASATRPGGKRKSA